MGYVNLNKKSFLKNAKYYTQLLGSKDKICISLNTLNTCECQIYLSRMYPKCG